MTETTPQVVRSYLAELDAALQGLPDSVRDEILGGVREELAGLDAATAATRIDELGDPAFIASEARAEAGEVTPTTAPSSGWFEVAAALLVAFGGIVVPVVGWVAGIVMMWVSRAWFRWEKWVATFAALGAALVLAVVLVVVNGLFAAGMSVGPVSLLHIDVLSLGLLPGLLNIPVGLWLLWRVRRTPRPRP